MKAFLWPELDGEASSRPLDRLIERAGLGRVDSVEDYETALFLHSSASRLRPETLTALMAQWTACPGNRPLHVSVAPDPAMRWHLFEMARMTMDRCYAWDPHGSRVEVSREAIGGRFWVELTCLDAELKVLWHDARWVVESEAMKSASDLVIRAGSALLLPGDYEVVGFDLCDLPAAKSFQVRVAILGCRQEDANWRVPFPLPGYTDYDPRASVWCNLQAGGATITGRQNAPEILKVTPSVMVGTGAQFRRWQELVAAGEARGVRIDADEAVDVEAA